MRPITNKCAGFTLIEVMIVIVVVAILMTVALPAYQDYIMKSRRADGMDAIMTIQQLEERYRANNSSYGDLTDIGWDGTDSLEGYYGLSVSVGTGTASAIEYSVTADGQNGQQDDDDCDPLTVTVNADYPRGLRCPADCWKRTAGPTCP